MRRLSPPVAALACLLVALLAWVSPAAAQTVRLPGGVQPLMQQRPCLEDCDPPPNSPPVVTIVAPGGTVATRTPVVLARFQPGGTVPSDEIYSVSVSWEGTNVTALGRTNASRLFEWEVSSSHQLSPGTQKVLSVTVCSQALLCTIEVRHVWLDVGNGPILSFMPMPLEALGRRPSSALGPDFAIGGTDVVTAVSTPAYYSRDTPRTAGLTYSSRQSYPRAVVNVDLEFSGGAPSWLKMRLLDGAVVLDSFVQVTPSCTSGGQARCRATLQTSFLAASSYPAVRKWLRVEAQATVGGQNYSSTDSVEAVLVDRRATPYGSGWWPSGVFRLVTAGADAIIVADDGSATIYRGNDNTYLSPPGDYSALVKTGSGWELQFREGGKLIFDSQGRQTAIQGTYPLWQTTISYNTADQVYRITDPAGKYFQFSYGSGVTIQDPGGRSSGAGLSNGQLISWTPPTPSGHNYTRAFAWRPFASNAVLPDSVGNALGQYTTLQYDSHWQPLQVQLPVVQNDSGSAVRPVLRYEAQELRGVGAAASLDTLRAHAVDARGNWSSSRLNRWGQSLMSWDVVDTTSRNTYSDIGLLLTSEGKSGDSTRVYYTYDALGHLIHTHRLGGPGGTLRLDSLVWDANHRVIKRFGTFSDSTIYQYNGAGSVTYTASSVGDTTLNYYNMYTLRLDSTHTAGVAGTTKFFHGGTFANTDSVRAPDGTTISRNLYDGYGRLTSAASKTVVQATSGSTELQWRRRLIYFNVANQVDSVRIERTDNCTAPCLNPSWPDPADTLRTLARRRIYAYLGQDSVLVGPTGGAEEVTAYDALGRIVSRSVAGSPTETYRYDRAGNLRFRVTRRGHQLESQYDTRNRVTKSVIPTVGTFNYAYGGANGPNDELTSVTAEAGYADPVGGSNPNVAWAFNPAGRVLSETTQGNRTTSFAYDIYGRVASFADAIGTWQLRFHTQHGTPDTLVTPFGDRVAYALDGQGRLDGPWLTGTGASLSRTQEWRTQGGLGVLTNAVNGGAYVPGRLRLADTEPDAAYDSLSPLWTEQRGLGQPTHTAVDSLRFDGWGRVTRAFYLNDDQNTGTQYLTYDRAGNLSVGANPGPVWTFSATGNRLLAAEGCGYGYDAAGNMTYRFCGDYPRTFTYDAVERLTSFVIPPSGTSVAYSYDALGQRIAKSVGGTVTRFVWRGGHVMYETDGGSTVTRSYTWGRSTDDLVAIHDHGGGGHYYVVQDRLRSVRALVSRNDGSYVGPWRYSVYGVELASATAPFPLRFRYAGAQYDEETGWYYLRSRYYEPGRARFIQEDPLGYAASMNLYAYTDGNPTIARDPSGLSADNEYQGPSQERHQDYCSINLFEVGCWGSWLHGGDGWGDWNGDGWDDYEEFVAYSWGEQRYKAQQGRDDPHNSNPDRTAEWQKIFYEGILRATPEVRATLLRAITFGDIGGYWELPDYQTEAQVVGPNSNGGVFSSDQPSASFLFNWGLYFNRASDAFSLPYLRFNALVAHESYHYALRMRNIPYGGTPEEAAGWCYANLQSGFRRLDVLHAC